jgi:hypothetical protein
MATTLLHHGLALLLLLDSLRFESARSQPDRAHPQPVRKSSRKPLARATDIQILRSEMP